MNSVVLNVGPVDQVLVLATDDNLTCNDNLVVVVITQGALLLVAVVESDGHRCLGHAGLTVLVHQLL